MRIAIIDSHPIQYHYQYYCLLARDVSFDVHVFFCLDTRSGVDDPSYGRVRWDVPVDKGYPLTYLRNLSPVPGFWFFGQINPGLITKLKRDNFDIVWVWGYNNLPAWLAGAVAKVRGLRVLYRGEASLLTPCSRLKLLIKKMVIRLFFRLVDGVAYSCRDNLLYYEYYGVPHEKLIFCPCAVDNKFFREQSKGMDQGHARQLLGLPSGARILLFVGRLTDIKRPFDIIRAFQKLTFECGAILLFVGDGPLSGQLKRYCKKYKIGNVRFFGFRNQRELPAFYIASDVLVLASEIDPSPKAANEAMNFGLPIVASDRVGTVGDLLVDGWNALVVPMGDVEALAEACERILSDQDLRARMRKNALRQIDNWSFEKGYEAIRAWALRNVEGR